MSRRFPALLLALGLLLAAAPAVAAPQPSKSRGHVVFNKSSSVGSLYVSQGLLPGHQYRLKVWSKKETSFSTMGFQNFVYVVGKRAVQDSRGLALTGKTPYSYTLKQPVSQSLREWIMAMTVSLTSKAKMTVKIIDLGKA